MKQMTVLKGAAVVLISVFTLNASAQTDTTRRDTTRRDTTGRDTSAMNMQDQVYTITDLSNNMVVDLFYDTVNFRAVNKTTGMPVEFYVVDARDTIHGPSGLIVNNMLIQEEGKYKLDDAKVKIEEDEMKIKMADGRKVKWENGKMKIKEWGKKSKVKSDKQKMKDEWTKVKWKEDEWKARSETGR